MGNEDVLTASTVSRVREMRLIEKAEREYQQQLRTIFETNRKRYPPAWESDKQTFIAVDAFTWEQEGRSLFNTFFCYGVSRRDVYEKAYLVLIGDLSSKQKEWVEKNATVHSEPAWDTVWKANYLDYVIRRMKLNGAEIAELDEADNDAIPFCVLPKFANFDHLVLEPE